MTFFDYLLTIVIIVAIATAVVLAAHMSEPANVRHRDDPDSRAFGAWSMFAVMVALAVLAGVMLYLINQ